MTGWLRALATVLLLLAALPAAGQGSMPVGAPAAPAATDLPDSPAAVRALVARLSDAEVRALLLERLDAVAAEAAGPSGLTELADSLGAGAGGFAEALGWALDSAPNLPAGIGQALSTFYAPRGLSGTLHLLAVLALALVAGALAQRGLMRLAGRLDRTDLPAEAGVRLQLAVLGRRLGVELAGALAFLGATWAVIALAHPPEPISYLILFFLVKQPILYVMAMQAVSRFLLAPGSPRLRLIEMTDADARFLHRSLMIFAAIVGMRAYMLSFLGGHGVDLASIRMGFWMNLLVYGWLLRVIWLTRHALSAALLGSIAAATPVDRAIARAFPWFAMVLIALFWALTEMLTGLRAWALLDGRLPLTLLILIFAPVGGRLVRWVVTHTAGPMTGEGEIAARAHATRTRSLIRIGRVLGAFLLFEILRRIWGLDYTTLAGAGVGARLAGHLIGAASVVGIGYILWELARIRINRILSREVAEAPGDADAGGEGGGAGGSRLATVLPLLSMALQAAIVVLTALIALSELGIDTTPLLAGAGIVGLAVGFGAQKLVADVVAGVFFLVDDAFRTGEYVEVGGTFGTVEKISIRALQLRHHEGPVHTIPFGEIPKLTNYSRDWVIMKLRFTVPFDTDLNKVKKLFKKIGAEMIADERFRDDFLQPFKSQGVLEVDDIGIVIRGKFMAKPGRQWVLRKEIYARVQQVFEENGIQFARREVRVKIDGDPADTTPEQRQRIATAAAETAVPPPAAPAASGGPG